MTTSVLYGLLPALAFALVPTMSTAAVYGGELACAEYAKGGMFAEDFEGEFVVTPTQILAHEWGCDLQGGKAMCLEAGDEGSVEWPITLLPSSDGSTLSYVYGSEAPFILQRCAFDR